jgi:hypothetical protein
MSDAKGRKEKLLRYGELAARLARDELTDEEKLEMERIRRDLDLSHEQVVLEVEKIVKEGY